MAIRFHITTSSTTPIFRQIVEQVRTAVATGKLVTGDGLPSVRALASELVVNPNTVAKAYAELCRDGVTEARRGRGVFVARQRQVLSKAERNRRLTELAAVFVREATLLGFSREEGLSVIVKRWAAVPEKETKS